jgi:hypothetical protein
MEAHMIRHLFYGQVRVGEWRDFYKLWEKLDETIRAKSLVPSQLWAPVVGTLSSFMLTTDYETIEAFQGNQGSFYGDAESMTIWRDMAKHFDSPPEDELWQTAAQIA